MVFALYSKVVQNLAAAVEFVHSIIKTLNCCDWCSKSFIFHFLLYDLLPFFQCATALYFFQYDYQSSFSDKLVPQDWY